MTSTVEIEPSELRSDGVGEKRPVEEDVGVSLVENEVLPPPQKRIKGGRERDLKKVAEMVLILAATGKMRGGRGPTLAEKELMVEARNRLAKVCEGFAPNDVFPRDAFGGLIEDLGLNKLNDQRTGFRPPKISIADKLLISKRKMEKAEDLSLPSTPYSAQRLQGNSSAAVESHGTSHSVKISHLGTSNRLSISAGNLQSASPLGHVTTSTATTPLPYQLPTSEIRPILSTASTSSHLGASAFPRVDRPQLRSDGRSNGSLHPSQIHVNPSANSAVRTPTWTVQPHSVQPDNVGSNNKVPVNMSLRFEGAANVKSGLPSQVASMAVIAHTTGPSSQGTNYAHAETAKIVQKLLQPRVSDRPVWNPPSRDYMSKALTCQMCRSAVTDIESILICDACEKGYHLKCLQMTYQNGISKAEWHCGKCLSLSNGKPLPPKYGRVMRNINTPKVSSESPAVPSTKSKIIDALDDKVPQSKMTFNGNTLPETIPTEVAGINSQIPRSKRGDAKEIRENDNDESKVKMDDTSPGTCSSNTMKSSLSDCVSSMDSSGGKPSNAQTSYMDPSSSAMSELVPSSLIMSQANVNSQHGNPRLLNDEASPSMQSLENYVIGDSEDIHRDETSKNAHQPQEQEVKRDNPSEIAIDTGIVNKGSSSTGGLHAVNWVGDPTQVLDDKIYYESCCITEHLYKAMDYVLIRFEDSKIIPSKLQTMWEDKNTTVKWVTVNQCYFPGDLPEAVGRPCGLESREVYESTKSRTLMAGLIQSPCEVLPPRKFEEGIERRTRKKTQTNDQLPPLYLCKWIYDEEKRLFRDISC